MRRIARIRGRRPSPALAVSIIALVMAGAGTAAAAKVLVTSSKQIAKGAVNSGDVKDGSLKLSDLETSARAAIGGEQASAVETFRKDGPADVPRGEERVIATANLEPGAYAIFSKTVLTPGPGEEESLLGNEYGASAHCILRAGEDRDETRALLTSPGYNAPGELSNQITATFASAGTVKLSCDSPDRGWRATDTSIIAIRVARAPRHPVGG